MNRCLAACLLLLPGIVLVVITAIFGWVIFPSIIHGEVVKNVRLVKGSDTWEKWVEAPIPIYLSFYIHHVTNPDQVENGLKPIFQEKGPYAYRQKRVKVDLRQDDGPNTVKYREVKTFYFDREHSGSNTEGDLVNVPNIPFVAVLHAVHKQLPLDIVSGIVGNILLQNESMIKRNVRVDELLFQGFDVTKYTRSLLASQLPKEFDGGRFGLYKGKNGTASVEWQVYTGYDNSQDFGRVRTYDGKPELMFWRRYSDCDKVTGTDGSVFPPFVTKDSKLSAFSPDVCRSLEMAFEKEIEYMGIPGYRFSAPELLFEDPRIYPPNQCFCLKDKLEDCPHAGVLPLESCMGGAPIYMSSPYFLGADVRYLTESGLPNPDITKHGTFIDLEPTTGLILNVHKRIQISLEMRSYRKVRTLRNLHKDVVIFPLIWADESAQLDQKLVDELRGQLFTPMQIVGIAKWVLIVLGTVLFAIGTGVFVNKYLLNTDTKGKEVASESETSRKSEESEE